MSWRENWYPDAIKAAAELRGEGAPGADGVPAPLLTSLDTIGILGLLSPAVVDSVKGFMDGSSLRAVGSQTVNTDAGSGTVSTSNSPSTISIADYVAGYVNPGDQPWQRATSKNKFFTEFTAQAYEPWTPDNVVTGHPELLMLVHSVMASWQRAVDACSACILGGGVSLADQADQGQVATFLSAVRSLCTDLDSVASNPPADTYATVSSATIDALHKSEAFVGKEAAKLAKEAASGAGQVTKGFLDELFDGFGGTTGAIALVVASVAVYLYVF